MELDFQVRYFLEHKALPQALWNNRAQLLLSLLREKQNAMIDFYRHAGLLPAQQRYPQFGQERRGRMLPS